MSAFRAPSACRDLQRVRAPGGRGLYASSGELFRKAVFARDALEAAEDLLDRDPAIAREVILTMAERQGTRRVADGPRSTEEDAGRIHHEDRERIIDGRPVDPDAAAIIVALALKWGGDADRMTYYGSVDATPLFVRLVGRYCETTGSRAILDETFVNKDGRTSTIREAVAAAAEWVATGIEESERTSGLGLFEYHRRNPRGMEYQNWRDGLMSMLHPARARARRTPALPERRAFEDCGELSDPDKPYATIEVQGVAYDALRTAARLIGGAAQQRYDGIADRLRANIFKHYWMPQQQYFAAAIDRDAAGKPRQVSTITSAPAELLDTELFDGVDAANREKYVGALVTHVTAADILTDAGVRTTSLRHHDQLDHIAYQGAFTVWHKQTFDVARGLRRQGFPRLATQLENRLLNTCNAGGMNNEYVYVDGLGRVLLDPGNSRGLPSPETLAATNIPDECQAWTVSAVLAIKRRHGRRLADVRSTDLWTRTLETDIMSRIHRVDVIASHAELARLWDASPAVNTDRVLGKQLEAAFSQRWRAEWGSAPGPDVQLSA